MDLDFDALLSQAGLAGLQDIPLSRIAPDPGNPRRRRDETQLTELAASIRARGVLQPITVQPANADGLHIIRFGERRYLAARMVGLATLIDQTTENDQREPLSSPDMVEAVERLIQAGHSHAEIGEKLGRPRVTISHYAAVQAMPEKLRRLLPDIAVRPLYDLYQLWKREPTTVDLLLETADPASITRRTVRELARTTEPAAHTPSAIPIPAATSSFPPKRREEAADRRHVPARTEPPDLALSPDLPVTGRLTVAVGERVGRLLFSPAPIAGQALVLFDGDRHATPEAVPLDGLRIVRLVAA
jgi:ParB family transcriptional regulator, chromosome partitioning protein